MLRVLPRSRFELRPGSDPSAAVPQGAIGPGLPDSTEVGILHSFEAGSCVDGPGIRMVLFTAGCMLRCQFCHNPDTWFRTAGTAVQAEDLLHEIGRCADFLRGCNGGITFSGGEPLYQWPFVHRIVTEVRRRFRLHTAIQTAGFLGARVTDAQLADVDLWMVDLKSADPVRYREVTGVDQPNVLNLLRRLHAASRPTWVSYVLVPGLTDDPRHIDAMGELLRPMTNLIRVEIRPFHQLGRDKWIALGVPYPLQSTPPPTPEQTQRVLSQLAGYGLPVVVA